MFRMIYKDETQEVWLPSMLIDIINECYNRTYISKEKELKFLIHEAMSYVREKVFCLAPPVVSEQILRLRRDGGATFSSTEEGKCFNDALEMVNVAFCRTEGELTREWADELEDAIYEHYYNEYGVNCYAHLMEKPIGNVNYFIAVNKGKDTFILFVELNDLDIWHDIVEESNHE